MAFLSLYTCGVIPKLPPNPRLHLDIPILPPSRSPSTQALLICTYQSHQTPSSSSSGPLALVCLLTAWVTAGSLLLTDEAPKQHLTA